MQSILGLEQLKMLKIELKKKEIFNLYKQKLKSNKKSFYLTLNQMKHLGQ